MSERGWDGRLRTSSAQALYLHVPFCARVSQEAKSQ